jgi:hypothetical protein
MRKTSLSLAVLTSILVTIFLVEPMTESVYAQSSKPSPPVFSTRVVPNFSIEFNITNQPFTNSSSVNAISYTVRAIDPDTGLSVQYPGDNLKPNGTYTILTMPMSMLSLTMPNASSVNFQMQAQTGYYSRIYKQGQMQEALFPTQGYWEYNFFPA